MDFTYFVINDERITEAKGEGVDQGVRREPEEERLLRFVGISHHPSSKVHLRTAPLRYAISIVSLIGIESFPILTHPRE
jgi:hypothetical protein